MPTENNRIWTPGEIITANKLNYIENFLTNINTNFVSTNGSTIKGDIFYKLTNVDLTQTNNGVTDKLYPAIAIFQDDNEKSFARVEGSVWPDNEEEDFKGSTWVNIWARNYKTSDKTEVTNALRLGVNKDGKLLVKFTAAEKEAWRKALGIIDDDYLRIDNAILQTTGDSEAQTIDTPLETTDYFGGESAGGQWWKGKDNALFRNFSKSSDEVYYPTISMDSPNGSWTIGTYLDNTLHFVYTPSSATSNNNVYNYSINTNGVFSGTAEKINARTLTIGNTGKSFNGTADVSWSLNEIGAAATSHNHSATNITSGTLPVVRGGTGAGSPSAARANLEAAALNHKHTMNDLTGTLQIEKGGTGAITKEAARTALGITPANIGALSLSGGTLTGTLYGTNISLSGGVEVSGNGEKWPITQKDSSGNNRIQMGVHSASNSLWLRQWVSSSVYENYSLPAPSGTSSSWYSILTTKTVRWGTVGVIQVAKNSVRSETIKFNYTFPSTPTVVATPFGAGATADGSVVHYGISDISTSGFTYKIYNSTDNSRYLGLTWIAIG